MKKRDRCFKALAILLILILLVTSMLPFNQAVTVQAAEKIKISEKALILNPGDTDILQVKGTKKKATWTSSDPAIVTVSNKGIVVAIKEGKAVITAQVSNKKLTCIVVVMRPENPYVGTAPFTAQEIDLGYMTSVIPKDWVYKEDVFVADSKVDLVYPPSTDTNQEDYTCITLQISYIGKNAPAYDVLKENYSKTITVENLEAAFKLDKAKLTISDLVSSDFTTTLGTAYKIKCNASFDYGTEIIQVKLAIYYLYIDQYYIALGVLDKGDSVTPDINQVAEYLLNSLQIKK